MKSYDIYKWPKYVVWLKLKLNLFGTFCVKSASMNLMQKHLRRKIRLDRAIIVLIQ